MKKPILVAAFAALVLNAFLATADGPAPAPAPTDSPRPRQRQAPPSALAPAKVQPSYQNTITFMSGDARGKTVTFVDVEAERQTWAVEGQALTRLGQFKEGQKLLMTWRTNEKGEPLAVIDLAPAPPPPARPAATRRDGDAPPRPGTLARPGGAANPMAAPSPAAAAPAASPSPRP